MNIFIEYCLKTIDKKISLVLNRNIFVIHKLLGLALKPLKHVCLFFKKILFIIKIEYYKIKKMFYIKNYLFNHPSSKPSKLS